MYTCVLVEQHMVKTPPLHLPGNAVPTLDATCDKVCQALPLLITERVWEQVQCCTMVLYSYTV